jgi:hypothetical protein
MSFTDKSGKQFETPDGKQPGSFGVPVTIHTPNGPQSGTWQGGYAVPDKKS